MLKCLNITIHSVWFFSIFDRLIDNDLIMSLLSHRIYLFSLVGITVFVAVYLAFFGANYYQTALEQRFFHEQNELLKPSGFIGHGFGVIGSLLIVVGVFGYMARKRFRRFSRWGYLKYWLEFHIFLCSLGPVLVLYHTAFKFGGIVAVSFWSMVAVVVKWPRWQVYLSANSAHP
jgi:hypothetical protein